MDLVATAIDSSSVLLFRNAYVVHEGWGYVSNFATLRRDGMIVVVPCTYVQPRILERKLRFQNLGWTSGMQLFPAEAMVVISSNATSAYVQHLLTLLVSALAVPSPVFASRFRTAVA